VNAVRHRCIRDSRAASAVAAVEAGVNRARRMYRRVDRLVVPSRFMAGVLERGGLGDRISVIPNFYEAADRSNGARPSDAYFLFVGRLDERKGVPVLLDAFHEHGGPARMKLIVRLRPREHARAAGVELLGIRTAAETLQEIAGAAALIVPSSSEENCPMTVLEAWSQRTPVIGSNRGGIPELVEDGADGLLFEPESAGGLAERMRMISEQPALADELARRGLERLRSDHSKARYYADLMEAYATARG